MRECLYCGEPHDGPYSLCNRCAATFPHVREHNRRVKARLRHKPALGDQVLELSERIGQRQAEREVHGG